jgi:hypothetical protein
MSYAHNNHYEWVESAYKLKCSPLGKEVANILGYVGRGIYNAPINTSKINWADDYCIQVSWSTGLSNFDFKTLTELVIECHRRMIRVTIGPNMKNLKIQFWQRHSRTGSMSKRMPDIEEMIEMLDASRGYQNNVEVIKTSKDLMMRTLEIAKA